MIETAIIPDHQILILPVVPVMESLVHHDGEELVEQRLRFGIRHVCNADGEARRDVKRLATRLRMGAHDRLEHLFRHLLVLLVVILGIGASGGNSDSRILDLADVMDAVATLDPLPEVRRERVVDLVHVAEFGVAAPARIAHGIEHGAVAGLFVMRGVRMPEVAGIHDADGRAVGPNLIRQDQDVGIIRMRIGAAVLGFEWSELTGECRLLLRRQSLGADNDDRVFQHRPLERAQHLRVERLRTIET